MSEDEENYDLLKVDERGRICIMRYDIVEKSAYLKCIERKNELIIRPVYLKEFPKKRKKEKD